ncbi:LysR family transcriptional regulator [Neisseriaceae bacterium CLB008]
MNNLPQTNDLLVFIQVVRNLSFIKAADEMGVSPAYISKRMQILEKTLGCRLLHRNTRTLTLTEDGEVVYDWGCNVVSDLNSMTEIVTSHSDTPSGSLYITSTSGFGRQFVTPILSEFARAFPQIKIRFDTVDHAQDLISKRIDLDIYIGNEIAPNVIAKKLVNNRRILCASADYLAQRGTPKTLNDLLSHECLAIKEKDRPFAIWELNNQQGKQNIKISGRLASNNGHLVKQWALSGHGIMLRSLWDVYDDLVQGRLVHVLPSYWQEAHIWALYPNRLSSSAKLRACVEYFANELPKKLTQETDFINAMD